MEGDGTLETQGCDSTAIKLSTIPPPPRGLQEILVPTAPQEARFHWQQVGTRGHPPPNDREENESLLVWGLTYESHSYESHVSLRGHPILVLRSFILHFRLDDNSTHNSVLQHSVFCAYYCNVPKNPTKKRAEVDFPLISRHLLSTFCVERLGAGRRWDGVKRRWLHGNRFAVA